MTNTTTTTCYVHPTRETSLRCKKCERYICTSCAIHTPTGYMCKECVRERKKVFDTAMWYDYLIGFGVTFVLSIIASILTVVVSSFIGFYGLVIAFFIAGGAGALIADIALRAVKKRRSKALFISCAAGVAAGALLLLAILFFTGRLTGLLGILIYIVVATPTVYTRISGIQLTR
jgi:hypothetical protein